MNIISQYGAGCAFLTQTIFLPEGMCLKTTKGEISIGNEHTIGRERDTSVILPEHICEIFEKATCLYSKAEVEAALDTMAVEISSVLSSSNPIFLCVVVGGIVPLGNLLPRLDFPLEVDYIHITRYRGDTKGKNLEWKAKPTCNIKDRMVLVVDDILDGGITLGAIINFCKEQKVQSVYSAVLVDKCDARLPGSPTSADFSGLKVGNRYVFGYGMDYKGYLRNAPGIYRIAPEHEEYIFYKDQ